MSAEAWRRLADVASGAVAPGRKRRLMLGTVVPPLALGLMIMAVPALVPMRWVPSTMPMGGAGPASAHPGVMSRAAVPVAADPYKARPGTDSNDHFAPWRRRRRLKIDVQRNIGEGRGGRDGGGQEPRQGEKAEPGGQPNRGAGSAAKLVHSVFHRGYWTAAAPVRFAAIGHTRCSPHCPHFS